MSNILKQAKLFFEACETGKGWAACKAYCHSGATFSVQAGALSGVNTLEGYTDWMKNLLTPVPDGRYELKFFAADEERNCVAAFAVFHGTHTGQGGPVAPTGKSVAADYVYAMQFDGDRIRHMTSISDFATKWTRKGNSLSQYLSRKSSATPTAKPNPNPKTNEPGVIPYP